MCLGTVPSWALSANQAGVGVGGLDVHTYLQVMGLSSEGIDVVVSEQPLCQSG